MTHLTTKQAGRIRNVNSSRIRQFIIAGRLPAIRFGRSWMIDPKDLDALVILPAHRPKKNMKTENSVCYPVD
jgi:excisionase family DNA binding protein